jgi:hypothetical protein
MTGINRYLTPITDPYYCCNYNLDKATKLYALITNVKNDSAAKYSVSTDGHDPRSIGAGFRYNF